MSPVHLLDVNVLVAIFDVEHQHHSAAHAWLGLHREEPWATCAITEAGFIRIASTLSAVEITPQRAAADLKIFQQSSNHEFWPCPIAPSDAMIFDLSQTPAGRHSTDIYLAGLAYTNGGHLVTFDRRIPWPAVRKASADLIDVIPS